jgi:hypothetical protein
VGLQEGYEANSNRCKHSFSTSFDLLFIVFLDVFFLLSDLLVSLFGAAPERSIPRASASQQGKRDSKEILTLHFPSHIFAVLFRLAYLQRSALTMFTVYYKAVQKRLERFQEYDPILLQYNFFDFEPHLTSLSAARRTLSLKNSGDEANKPPAEVPPSPSLDVIHENAVTGFSKEEWEEWAKIKRTYLVCSRTSQYLLCARSSKHFLRPWSRIRVAHPSSLNWKRSWLSTTSNENNHLPQKPPVLVAAKGYLATCIKALS